MIETGYVILSGLLTVCIVGWFMQRISTMTLLWYLQEKNCPFPTGEELKKGSRFVVEHMLKDFFGGKQR